MPRISEFFGVVVAMYFNDHFPPHFHAKYAEDEALIDIQTGSVVEGPLSSRALGLVEEWRKLRQAELMSV